MNREYETRKWMLLITTQEVALDNGKVIWIRSYSDSAIL